VELQDCETVTDNELNFVKLSKWLEETCGVNIPFHTH